MTRAADVRRAGLPDQRAHGGCGQRQGRPAAAGRPGPDRESARSRRTSGVSRCAAARWTAGCASTPKPSSPTRRSGVGRPTARLRAVSPAQVAPGAGSVRSLWAGVASSTSGDLIGPPPSGHDGAMASAVAGYAPAYRVVLAIGGPDHARWARMTVTGLERLPPTGPALSSPTTTATGTRSRSPSPPGEVRQIRALAKSTLWKNKVVGAFMDGMGHIPVERGGQNADGDGDRDRGAAQAAPASASSPRATRSLGRALRARTGVGRLAEAVPEARRRLRPDERHRSTSSGCPSARASPSSSSARPAGSCSRASRGRVLRPAAGRAARRRPAGVSGPQPHRGQVPRPSRRA